ncbi:4'-phosphopantetheinyl transferase superfamily protein [Ideonella azotifigens]|uniref:4'-phosphopantetheinyl transferase domain-containing protein n=1 Tax=Ideonella azotifigens TaxID=513160 RepID=A0ABN1KE15_9BURK|nr:4'-phosphopantetheinyl transferase superfamily protein [Ideonella azotifigens]MCD2342095.1 4'-phosphopantetheinyl transferase superfamily protein [Ideonella azotifigens]
MNASRAEPAQGFLLSPAVGGLGADPRWEHSEAGPTSFGISTITVASTVLWQDARLVCDQALGRGCAFVAILHEAGDFADEHVLADADRQRAMRYRQAGDRKNFVLGRTMVHHLVRPRGALVPCAFSFGVHGKPFLPGLPAFNLSHSAEWVACAVSPGESVGIDVEAFLRLGDHRDLLAGTTHPAERLAIARAEPDEQPALFKRCWTRKEAVLKATGKGLSDDLCAIDVGLAERQPLVGDPASLRLVDLLVGDDRVTACLALEKWVPGVVVMHVSR